MPVADPGFPAGGVHLVGGADSRGSCVSKILYVKTKQSGPLRWEGGVSRARPLDPPMYVNHYTKGYCIMRRRMHMVSTRLH